MFGGALVFFGCVGWPVLTLGHKVANLLEAVGEILPCRGIFFNENFVCYFRFDKSTKSLSMKALGLKSFRKRLTNEE